MDGRPIIFAGENYAVAILDIGMPGFDGLEVVHRLKARADVARAVSYRPQQRGRQG